MINLVSVINFCTHDLRFLDRCIQGVKSFSSQILIPVCDHFYNGEPENLLLLERIYQKYPSIDFIQFAYSEKEVYGTPSQLVPHSPGWAQHWHNSARLIGTYFLKPEVEWVLFLDVDEIFSQEVPYIERLDAVRFATYWYFKRADNCATIYPDGPLLVRREKLSHEGLLDEDERMGLFCNIEGKKEREYLVDGQPIVHHYSWVRSEKELVKKTACWGHHWERDWKALLKNKGDEDFVRGYQYRKVKAFWDPLQEKMQLPKAQGPFNHVTKITPKEFSHLEIQRMISRF